MAKVTNIKPAAAIDPAILEKAAEDTARMGRADRVFHWDKRQGGPDPLLCGHDRSHGKLIINGAGTVLMCGATKGGAACTYNQPVSV